MVKSRIALKQEDSIYLVVLEGLPERMMARMNNPKMGEALKASTEIKRNSKGSLHPAQVQMGKAESSIMLIFAFPRTEPIVLEDKEIEFVSKMGPMEFKKKFKLADMVVNGKLSL